MRINNFDLKKVAIILGGSGVLSGVIFLCQSGIKLSDFALTRPPVKIVPQKSIQPISLAEFLVSRQEEETLVVDLRPESQFSHGHIPQAINLPMENSAKAPPFPKLATSQLKQIILYAGGMDDPRAYVAAKQYNDSSTSQQIFVYQGGWPEWKVCSLPAITGG